MCSDVPTSRLDLEKERAPKPVPPPSGPPPTKPLPDIPKPKRKKALAPHAVPTVIMPEDTDSPPKTPPQKPTPKPDTPSPLTLVKKKIATGGSQLVADVSFTPNTKPMPHTSVTSLAEPDRKMRFDPKPPKPVAKRHPSMDQVAHNPGQDQGFRPDFPRSSRLSTRVTPFGIEDGDLDAGR